MSEPEYISTTDATKILGVSDAWVLRLLKQGELNGFRLNGRAWAISRKSVMANKRRHNRGGVGRPRREVA